MAPSRGRFVIIAGAPSAVREASSPSPDLTPERDEETGKLDYAFDISLRNDSAALAGGRVIVETGCGGRI